MYNVSGPVGVASAGASATIATLPDTGGFLFIPLAGFALIAAGCALLRILPRKEA